MASPIEATTGTCLYGACDAFNEFDAGRGYTIVEDGIELEYPSEEGAKAMNECLATAGCFLAANEEEDVE